MNKYLGFTVGISLVGSAAFGSGTNSSLASTVDNIANGQTTYQSGSQITVQSGGQSASLPSFKEMFVTAPVPEPATMAVLATLAGGLIVRKRNAKRP